MKKLCSVFVLATCFCFSAGAQSKSHSSEDPKITARQLIQGTWTLQWLKDGDVAKLYPSKKPVMNINAMYGKISGFNGCNNFFGSIKIEGDRIIFKGPLGSTKMACDQVDEQKFMSVINQVKTFKMHDSSSLELITVQGAAMRFTRMSKSANTQKQIRN